VDKRRAIVYLPPPLQTVTETPPSLWAQIAQLVEHATENRSVGGSIPLLGTISPFLYVTPADR
jgi:hypothetical protein